MRARADLEGAFRAAAAAKAQAALRMIDPLVFVMRQETAALAAQYHLPMIYPSKEDVEAGGLAAYGSNTSDMFRQVGIYSGRILKGEKPADLPVHQATKLDLVINLATAKTLGLKVPSTLLGRADEVIE